MDRALISKSALAELAGVHRSAVGKLCRPGKKLEPALVRGKIDRMHPAVQEYIHDAEASQRVHRTYKKDPTAAATAGKTGSAKLKAAKKASPPPAPTDAPRVDPMDFIAGDVRDLADKSLRELVGIFGTDERFVDWLKSVHEMEKVQNRRLINAEKEGVLISRKLVADGIIDPIDTMNTRLMTDGARTIGTATYAMGKAGRTEQEFIDYVVEQIGAFVRALKPKIEKALRDA